MFNHSDRTVTGPTNQVRMYHTMYGSGCYTRLCVYPVHRIKDNTSDYHMKYHQGQSNKSTPASLKQSYSRGCACVWIEGEGTQQHSKRKLSHQELRGEHPIATSRQALLPEFTQPWTWLRLIRLALIGPRKG